jgi:hypothetical protein
VRIQGSGSGFVSKCHGSGTLLQSRLKTSTITNSITLQRDINLIYLYLETSPTNAFLVISVSKKEFYISAESSKKTRDLSIKNGDGTTDLATKGTRRIF